MVSTFTENGPGLVLLVVRDRKKAKQLDLEKPEHEKYASIQIFVNPTKVLNFRAKKL